MATPKKKLAPAATPAPSVLIPGRDFDVHALRGLTDQTRELADSYETVIENLSPDMTCPQRVMRAALEGPKLVEQAARFSGLFSKFALDHRTGEGGFMHEAEDAFPLVVIGFSSTGGAIAPKWKEEAVRLGRELADAKGEEFDEAKFEESIRARYKPGKIGTKIDLTEAG